jgi:hypothetical protein
MAFSVMIDEYCPRQRWNLQASTHLFNPLAACETLWPDDHPFKRIGKHLAKFPRFPVQQVDYFRKHLYSRSQQYRLKVQSEHCGSLQDVISKVSGSIYLSGSNESEKLPPLWIAPWGLDAFRASQFVELDASFHALRPYA